LTRVVEIPGSSPRPYGGWFDAAVDLLAEDLSAAGASGAIEKVVVDRGELTLFVRREHLIAVAHCLRDDQDLRFELSLGVNGVHYPEDKGRELHAVYHLMSVTHGRRIIRLEVAVSEADPHVPSLVDVYPTQDWHERETYDMFGIVFDGHPALARILMPNDWVGFPQRKDYPLGGVDVQFKGASQPPPDQRRSYS
jgi:NADH-quinone oxidoreductase subunit C